MSNRAQALAAIRAIEAMGRAVVPVEADYAITRAMAESRASDDEGQFEPMCDLLDFSGENKAHTVLRAAWAAYWEGEG